MAPSSDPLLGSTTPSLTSSQTYPFPPSLIEKTLHYTPNWLPDLGNLVMRFIVASLTIHHGLDKLNNAEGFTNGVVAKYFPFLPIPIFWTYLSASFEVILTWLIVIGLYTKPSAFILFMTMVFANIFHLEFTGLEGYPFGLPKTKAYAFEPSLAFMGVYFYLMCAGPGKFSVREHGF